MQKKLISGVLATVMALSLLTACGEQATDSGSKTEAEEQSAETTIESSDGSSTSALWPTTLTNSVHNSAAPDWTEYNQLIFNIKNTTDYSEREVMMHRA